MLKFSLFLLSVLICAGCSSGDGRTKVQGTVTFKNTPLDQGTIQFIPVDSQGSFSGTSITNGKYSIPAEQGLMPGKYKVVISSGIPNTTATAEEAPGQSIRPPAKERIPAEYNAESKQFVTIVSGAIAEFDFSIP